MPFAFSSPGYHPSSLNSFCHLPSIQSTKYTECQFFFCNINFLPIIPNFKFLRIFLTKIKYWLTDLFLKQPLFMTLLCVRQFLLITFHLCRYQYFLFRKIPSVAAACLPFQSPAVRLRSLLPPAPSGPPASVPEEPHIAPSPDGVFPEELSTPGGSAWSGSLPGTLQCL